MEYICCILIGYFIGMLNPSYLLGKIKGIDIREHGSCNAGASNIVILFGKTRGILCALLDIAKAYLSLMVAEALFPDFSYAFVVTAVSCIIGHIFPVEMNFKGGKGLACLGGIILYYNWKLFLIMLAIEIVLALATDYICFVPTTASIAFPLIYGYMEKTVFGAVALSIITIVIFIKHTENLKRVYNNTEMHLSYLWKPDKEIERMSKNMLDKSSKH